MSGSQGGPPPARAGRDPLRCVVVGGSLVGLSAAIALARLGFTVTVVERSPARAADGGGGLGVDVALLQRATGLDAEPPVLHGVDRDGTAWHLLQAWLEEHARAMPEIAMLRDMMATGVQRGSEDASAVVLTADGGRLDADLVVGADGARSTVRATVDPERPDGRYAGVVLWRAMVEEQELRPGVVLPEAGEPAREVLAGQYRLVTYPVPGPDGETAVGHRRLNMVWYDPQQTELLRSAGLLDGETIRGTLAPGTLPAPLRARLSDFAAANWPSPWREAIALALDSGAVFGTPIIHYKPDRLVSGRVALAGDAAHAASPMVGGGFRQGLQDVVALSRTLSGVSGPAEIPAALARYEDLRLGAAIAHVTRSEQATAAYRAYAARGPGR